MTLDFMDSEAFEDLIERAVKSALAKTIPAGIAKYQESVGVRLGMTVDLNIYAPDSVTGQYQEIQTFSSLPECPPLPLEGGSYVFKDPDSDSAPKRYIVDQIDHKYRLVRYQASTAKDEFVTEINVWLK